MILTGMFLVGVASLLAQMVLARELFVAAQGHEMAVALVLSGWLACVGLGAWGGRKVGARMTVRRAGFWAAGLLLGMAAALPLQLWVARALRGLWGATPGEYLSAGQIVTGTWLVLAPFCMLLGGLFPVACHAGSARDSRVITRVYFVESLGSLVGSLLFVFVLVGVFIPWRSLALAAALCVAAAACMAAGPCSVRQRGVLFALAAVCWLPVLSPRLLTPLERSSMARRWQDAGVLPHHKTDGGMPPARLVAWRDTPYQHLTLVEMAGLYVIYGNGEVLFSFPDVAADELLVRFVMTQHERPRRVLLLGGNPLGLLPPLLAYPLDQVVYVSSDPGLAGLLEEVAGPWYDKIAGAERMRIEINDGPLFVRQTQEQFDVVLVLSGAPTTITMNRYYTVEFYRRLQRRLRPGGIVFTRIGASERLEREAAQLAASVHAALRAVFPVVRTTAGEPTQFVAGLADAAITFDREALYRRAAEGPPALFFRPEYFLVADELEPRKVAEVERRLAASGADINRGARPIASHYALLMWSRYTAPAIGRLARKASSVSLVLFAITVAVLAALMMGIGSALKRTGWWTKNVSRVWMRSMLGLAMAATGWGALTLEVALMYVFQNEFGHLYARMGLLVALFMLGAASGAMAGGRLAVRPASDVWRAAALAGLGGAALALLMALGVEHLEEAVDREAHWLGSIMGGLMIAIGAQAGFQFAAVSRLYRLTQADFARTGGVVDAADHLGSMLGAMTGGALLIPALGVTDACRLVALLGILALMCLFSGRRAAPLTAGESVRG